MKGRRVTQKDIAEAVGLNRASVSMALRNDPSIPEKTRARIAAAAAKLGYAPDPMLSALAAYRSRSRPPVFHGTLGWIANGFPKWKENYFFRQYYEGATARASAHGYQVEVFDAKTPGISRDRFVNILRGRGIHGLIMCPQTLEVTEMDLPWDMFSCVAMGYSLKKPRLHVICPTQFRGAVLVMRNLRLAGYNRIGYLAYKGFNQGTDNNFLAGYLTEDSLHRQGPPIPPMIDDYEPDNTPAIVRWIRKHRLDAIMSISDSIPARLRQAGLKVPEDVGVGCTVVHPSTNASGLKENFIRAGQVAADTVTAMIQRGERGVPEVPLNILVEGIWVQGDSTQKPTAAL